MCNFYCMNVSTYLASAVILSVTVIILIRPSLVSTWPYLCCHHHGMSALADPAMVQRLAMLLLLSCPSYPSLLLSLPSTTTNCSTTQQHLHLLLNSSYYQFWAASGGLNFPSNPVVVLPRWCQTRGNRFYCFTEAALIYIVPIMLTTMSNQISINMSGVDQHVHYRVKQNIHQHV